MSGHSKWSKIKRQKESTDKQKSAAFSKLSRLITLAVIEGASITDPENNVRLRFAIEKAKSFNMPKDNIDRAIEKGAGPEKDQMKEVLYEAFAPHGVALLIVTTTDNANRTLTEVRSILENRGGKLGGPGSVSYLFKKVGAARFNMQEVAEEQIFAFAEKIGAYDIDKDQNYFHVYFPYEQLGKIKMYLDNLKAYSVEVDYKPQMSIDTTSNDVKKSVSDLIEALEDLDDVHGVFTNVSL